MKINVALLIDGPVSVRPGKFRNKTGYQYPRPKPFVVRWIGEMKHTGFNFGKRVELVFVVQYRPKKTKLNLRNLHLCKIVGIDEAVTIDFVRLYPAAFFKASQIEGLLPSRRVPDPRQYENVLYSSSDKELEFFRVIENSPEKLKSPAERRLFFGGQLNDRSHSFVLSFSLVLTLRQRDRLLPQPRHFSLSPREAFGLRLAL